MQFNIAASLFYHTVRNEKDHSVLGLDLRNFRQVLLSMHFHEYLAAKLNIGNATTGIIIAQLHLVKTKESKCTKRNKKEARWQPKNAFPHQRSYNNISAVSSDYPGLKTAGQKKKHQSWCVIIGIIQLYLEIWYVGGERERNAHNTCTHCKQESISYFRTMNPHSNWHLHRVIPHWFKSDT